MRGFEHDRSLCKIIVVTTWNVRLITEALSG
uniref:Uncharacterized protein n=1 Tax=viral metagenome TaxID=1070528 RepID=A0A6C0BN51_9ZZZZ